MKNNKGFAPLLIILLVVLVGGGTYAVVNRSVLKSFFEKGDKPSEAQFADTIDSSLNIVEDRDLLGLKEYNPTKTYEAGDTVVKSDNIYQAKALSEVQEKFTLNTSQPVEFRWTPLVPKPKENVTYRLKVWQLMQGQSGSQAMRTNQPIITKDVDNITQATVNGIYTGPCRPPYLCDFVWSVEVLSPSTTKETTSDGTTPVTIEETTSVEGTGSLGGAH